MYRSLLAASVAALFLTGLTGVTAAQDDGPRPCTVVESELAAAETAAQLPVTIGGATFTNLDALEQFRDQVAGVEAAQGAVDEATAVLDAAAAVSVLRTERTTCTIDDPDPTSEPTETQSPTDRPDEPLYADCVEARAFGAAPIAAGDPGYRAELDADGDGIACEAGDDGTAGGTGSGVLGGTNDTNSGVVDSVPSGSIDTGYAG